MRTLLFKIVLGTWFVLWTPLLLMALVSRPLCRKCIAWDAWGVLFWARVLAGINYKIHNTPFGPDGKPSRHQPIVASKHMSILEVAILVRHVPNYFFIIKKQLMHIPIYGWAFGRMGFQSINRTRGATNMKILAARVREKMNAGMTLIIYPEGTRALPGQRIPLKRGLLFLAETLKVPIQPVGTDAGLYWDRHGQTHPGTAHVYFEPILPHNATLDDIGDAINRRSA
jgi:1-acyl-sn-glycerol-3-phosphate acyltransferase